MTRRAGGSLLISISLMVLLGVAVLTADRDDVTAKRAPTSAECGLPSPDPDLDPKMLPGMARVSEEIVALDASGGFLSATLNVPMSVKDTLDTLHRRALAAGYEILQLDFEGFEAELFVRTRDEMGVLRIVISDCPQVSRLSVQLPKGN